MPSSLRACFTAGDRPTFRTACMLRWPPKRMSSHFGHLTGQRQRWMARSYWRSSADTQMTSFRYEAGACGESLAPWNIHAQVALSLWRVWRVVRQTGWRCRQCNSSWLHWRGHNGSWWRWRSGHECSLAALRGRTRSHFVRIGLPLFMALRGLLCGRCFFAIAACLHR